MNKKVIAEIITSDDGTHCDYRCGGYEHVESDRVPYDHYWCGLFSKYEDKDTLNLEEGILRDNKYPCLRCQACIDAEKHFKVVDGALTLQAIRDGDFVGSEKRVIECTMQGQNGEEITYQTIVNIPPWDKNPEKTKELMDICKKINDQQTSGKVHPYTCGNADCRQTLVAMINWSDGSIYMGCPKCDYSQILVPPIENWVFNEDGSVKGILE